MALVEVILMTISDQIRLLCISSYISIAELARRTGKSPQSFNAKLRRESFTISELEVIAKAVNSHFERSFVLPNGEQI